MHWLVYAGQKKVEGYRILEMLIDSEDDLPDIY